MSRGARWLLGTAAALFAFVFAFSEHTAPSKAPWLTYALAAFCLLVVVACFSARLRDIVVRVIGASVFLAYMWYFVSELVAAQSARESHWVKAALGLAVFGSAGLYVAVWGKFPLWGFGSEAFGSNRDHDRDNE